MYSVPLLLKSIHGGNYYISVVSLLLLQCNPERLTQTKNPYVDLA